MTHVPSVWIVNCQLRDNLNIRLLFVISDLKELEVVSWG